MCAVWGVFGINPLSAGKASAITINCVLLLSGSPAMRVVRREVLKSVLHRMEEAGYFIEYSSSQ